MFSVTMYNICEKSCLLHASLRDAASVSRCFKQYEALKDTKLGEEKLANYRYREVGKRGSLMQMYLKLYISHVRILKR